MKRAGGILAVIALVSAGCGEVSIPLQDGDGTSYCARLCTIRDACDIQAEDLCLKRCSADFPLGFPGYESAFDRTTLFAWVSCVEASPCGAEQTCLDATYKQLDVIDGVEACRAQAATCPYDVDEAVCTAYGFALEEARLAATSCWTQTCPNLEESFDGCMTRSLF